MRFGTFDGLTGLVSKTREDGPPEVFESTLLLQRGLGGDRIPEGRPTFACRVQSVCAI